MGCQNNICFLIILFALFCNDGCGCNNGCCDNWCWILILLLFCGNGNGLFGLNNGCGCNNCSTGCGCK